jgi:formylmethanofuran dehydrogenase subunit E
MSIEITKSAEETYRRVLNTLEVKHKGKEFFVLIDDDDNGGSISVYDKEKNVVYDKDITEAIQDCFTEYRETSELTQGKKFIKDKEYDCWEEAN